MSRHARTDDEPATVVMWHPDRECFVIVVKYPGALAPVTAAVSTVHEVIDMLGQLGVRTRDTAVIDYRGHNCREATPVDPPAPTPSAGGDRAGQP